MSPIIKPALAIIDAIMNCAAPNQTKGDGGAGGTSSANLRRICDHSLRSNEAQAQAAYREGLWVRSTLADALREAARSTPHRVALVDAEVRLDCATLYAHASALAQAMQHRVPMGSTVSFMLPNWHEAAAIYLGATLAGMVAHPILPSLRERELRYMLADAGSRMVFIPAQLRKHDYRAMFASVITQLPSPPEVIVVRGDPGPHQPYATMLRTKPPEPAFPALDADAVRMILYTSGTTGVSKGVMHSHNSIHALVRQIGEHWFVKPGDAFLVASPVSHIGGSIYAFECPLLLGARAILMERWDPDQAVRIALAERCTHMAGATPFLEQLLSAAKRAGTRLPDLKLFICGGASVPPTLIRQAIAHFEHAAVTRVYGSTEVPVATVGIPDRTDAAHASETDGKTGITNIRLTDETGRSVEEGEIRARGPQMLVGYLHPEDDTTAFDAEGYFRTGDIGRWHDGSYLIVSGRAKDIIIRNGENISPKEIEDILCDHPDIAEISVVGVPDPRTGERACAVIVPKRNPPPDLDSVRAFLAAQGVAKFKHPEFVVLRDALPKNDAGKVLKHRIRAELLQQTRGT